MKGFCKTAGLIIFILSAFMLCTSVKEYKAAFGEPVDINETYPEDYTKVNGVETELAALLGEYKGNPVTYAGGVGSMADIEDLRTYGKNRLDVTVGSALDLFGGSIPFAELIKL